MTVWFTADTHYGHKRIIDFQPRPFRDVAEMDETIIQRYNEVVKPGDLCYFLGDFSFYRTQVENEVLLGRLHGTKHLIVGNHDHEITRNAHGWSWVGPYKKIRISRQTLCLFHFPILVWDQKHYGSWHLHGHSHGSLPHDPTARRLDVGVDCHHQDFRPFAYDEVAEYLTRIQNKELGYHRCLPHSLPSSAS